MFTQKALETRGFFGCFPRFLHVFSCFFHFHRGPARLLTTFTRALPGSASALPRGAAAHARAARGCGAGEARAGGRDR